MLRDKTLPVKITVPAMTSGKTVTVDLSTLGMGQAEQEAAKPVPVTTGNYAVSKVKLTSGNYALRITASGSVNANTVVWVLLVPIGVLPEVTVAAVDA
jgi:hypothetical protein